MEAKAIIQPDRTDQLRAHLHAVWGSVAGGWREHADWVDNRGGVVTAEMLRLTAPRAGERVLELACGAGGLGLATADLVGPRGEVVVSDVAPEMTAIAAERARAAGLSNVSVRELDLEKVDEPDGSYDVVLCREGLMLVPDPVRAAREIRRVLRPGGRAAITVWGPRERNPWLGIVFDVVSAQLGAPVPPAGIPGPFSLDDADRFAGVLSEAGLSDVRVDELSTPYHATSFEDWWTRTSALAGPLGQMLAALPQPAADELHARARAAVDAYRSPSGIEIPGVSLVGGARHG
jgi:SAM-dependent methyltransferase